ncbi:hypothetical protein EDC04DRAFT_2758915 [Pisolithus marmoratus]|nr:hypothetical protein EDC04DRAFT_2758915 [Pisolithus marmoratus]
MDQANVAHPFHKVGVVVLSLVPSSWSYPTHAFHGPESDIAYAPAWKVLRTQVRETAPPCVSGITCHRPFLGFFLVYSDPSLVCTKDAWLGTSRKDMKQDCSPAASKKPEQRIGCLSGKSGHSVVQ